MNNPAQSPLNVQAEQIAAYLVQHPDSTAKEIDAACDTGCISKVLSDMPRMGYGLQRAWRRISCAGGQHVRRVRTYTLTHRPAHTRDLFSEL